MKTETMRIIDKAVGTPATKLLSMFVPAFIRPPLTHEPKGRAVIICKFFGIGSVCLSHPLIRELRDRGDDIVYLTFASNAPMVKLLGVENCLTIDPSSVWRFACGVFKVIWKMRRRRPAAFLNLEFFSRFAAIMSVMSGAPVRSGFHMHDLPVGKLYSHRANLNVYHHIFENYLNVGATAGLTSQAAALETYVDTFPSPPVPHPASQGFEPPDGDYIILNTETSDTLGSINSWPVSNWVELITLLKTTYGGHKIVLIGTQSNAAMCAQIRADLINEQNVIDATGRTGFDEFTTLIAGASLVITVDSSPLHLGAFMKRPTIGLFGPGAPVLYGYHLAWVRSICKNLMCSPCMNLYDAKKSVLDCRDNKCLKQISATEVLAAAGELLPTR